MRSFALVLLVVGGLFVVLVLLLPLMGNNTEKLYTRIYVQFYEERRLAAVKGDIQQAAQSLKSVVEYEPLKVRASGDLGRALKLVRQGAIREIITRMRMLSGEDLGEDPDPWIKKYYHTDNSRPNQPAAGKAGLALWLAFGAYWPGLPEPGRSTSRGASGIEQHFKPLGRSSSLSGWHSFSACDESSA